MHSFEQISPYAHAPKKQHKPEKMMSRRDFCVGATKILGATAALGICGEKVYDMLEDARDEKLINDKIAEIAQRIAERELRETAEQADITTMDNNMIGETFIEQIRTKNVITLDDATRNAIYMNWHTSYGPGGANEKGLTKGLERMQPWLSEIKEVFHAHNVPEEFAYLAIAESHFILDALSDKRAAGPYQIMKKTAQSPAFNFIVTKTYDERLDPIKSAELCAQHLKKSYDHFGDDWVMALMDYNGSKTNAYQKHLMKKEQTVPIHVRTHRHTILPKETLSKIAHQYNTSVTLLMRANNLSETDTRKMRPGQKLYIPQEREKITSARFNTWLEEKINTQLSTILHAPDYVVANGDTLGAIAQKHNIALKELKSINNLTSDIIHPGMQLTIPNTSQEQKRELLLERLRAYKEYINYPGKFHAIRDLIREQGLDGATRKPEQRYTYASVEKTQKAHIEYTIQKNDTLTKIAHKLYDHIQQTYAPFEQSRAFLKSALMQQNNIPNENKISIGKTLTLTVPTKQPESLASFAHRKNIDITALQKLNPAVLSPTAPLPQDRKIRIPL